MRQTLFLFSFQTYTTTKSLSLFRAFNFVLLLFFFLCLCFCFCFCLQVWFGLVCLCPTLLLLHSELQHLTSYARFLNSKSSRTIHSLNKNRSKIKKKKKITNINFYKQCTANTTNPFHLLMFPCSQPSVSFTISLWWLNSWYTLFRIGWLLEISLSINDPPSFFFLFFLKPKFNSFVSLISYSHHFG